MTYCTRAQKLPFKVKEVHYPLKTGNENPLENKRGLVEIILRSSHTKEKS